jgi:hypothetical protein
MDLIEIRKYRLFNQKITPPVFQRADEVVRWLGAVQAQDYAGAKWSLGLRMKDASDHEIERAFGEGAILRTHMLRPTWHFVHPEDIRWMLALTGPRVHAVNGHRYRGLKLKSDDFIRSQEILVKSLEGGRQLTRKELGEAFREGGIPSPEGQRLAYLVMHAELEGLVCSGPRRGKQFTYALLEERVPPGKSYSREEALFKLAERYFASRGPARVHDFAKWSGLTLADARLGLEGVKDRLQMDCLGDQEYWFSEVEMHDQYAIPKAHLLSIYDEYISGYKGWELVTNERVNRELVRIGNALNYIAVIDGQVVGFWIREIKKEEAALEVNILRDITQTEGKAIESAARKFSQFLGLGLRLELITTPKQ